MDAEKRPVAEAEVLAYSGTQFEKKVKTGADGAYAIKELPPGKYHLKARKGKSFSQRLPQYDIALERGSSVTVDLVLVAGGTIDLTVVDKKTKKPVAGANVLFDLDQPEKRTTDKDGKASISGFDYGTVGFQANADGYAKSRRYSYHEAPTEPGKTLAITTELEPEQTMTGVVADEKGQPLSDVVVTIDSRWQGRSGERGAEWEPAMTDEKGRFRLGGLEEGEYTYRLTATKEGLAPGRAEVQSEKMSGVQIVLRPGAAAEGTVRDAQGAPMKGVTVMLGEDLSTLSDDQGGWRIERIEKGTYTLVAEKGDLRSQEKKLDIQWTDRVTGMDLVLKKKGKDTFNVSGLIVDAIDGKPIPNVRLRFWQMAEIETTGTDKLGRFRFRNVPVGQHEMYFTSRPSPYIDPIAKVSVSITDRDVEDMVIKLPRGASVKGRVYLPSGQGAWEAKIRLIHPTFERSSRGRNMKVTTDAEGRFEAKDVPQGIGYRVRAEHKDCPPAVSEPFNLRQAETIEGIEVRFAQPGRLSGAIQDDQGKPLSKNYWLTANFPDVDDGAWNNSWILGKVTPNESGRFEMAGLPPGKVIVQLWHEGRGLDGSPGWHGVANRKAVQIVSGQETKDVVFVIGTEKPRKLEGYIAGRVVGIEEDKGIEGIDVYAQRPGFSRAQGGSGRARTGPDGRFRIENLEKGLFELRANVAHKSGYDEQVLSDIASPSEEIPVVLRRLCVVEGQVIEKNSRKPVTEFSIGEVGSKEQRIRDPQGRFRLENLQRGSCLLRAVADGVGVAQRLLELEEGETVRDVVLVLHEPWRIGGRVIREKDGAPVAGATVAAASLERDTRGKSVTDADGRFMLAGVFPPKETLFVEQPDFGRPWFPDIEIQDARIDNETVLKLQEPATVKGRVLFEKGFPYEGAELHVELGEGGYSRLFDAKATTGFEGDYAFSAIPPGRHTVVWNMGDPELGSGGYWGQTIELASSETKAVDFGRGGAIVAGVVTKAGRPRGLAVITFTSGPVKRWIQTDYEGKYRVYGLEPGKYHVTLTEPGQQDRKLVEKDIEIPKQGQMPLNFEIPAGAPAAQTEVEQ
jgi:hypothetical protein